MTSQETRSKYGAGRRLAGDPLPARPGTFLPCNRGEYFSGDHAHCAADVLKFYAADARFFQRLAYFRKESGLL